MNETALWLFIMFNSAAAPTHMPQDQCIAMMKLADFTGRYSYCVSDKGEAFKVVKKNKQYELIKVDLD